MIQRFRVGCHITPIDCKTHWLQDPLVARPIGCKTHWLQDPLVARPIDCKRPIDFELACVDFFCANQLKTSVAHVQIQLAHVQIQLESS